MRNNRRELLIVLGAGMLSVPLAFAQKPATMQRIGYMHYGSVSPARDQNFETFKQRLHELGYVEGKTVTIEYRTAEGNHERLPALAAELVRRNVDVIFTTSTPSTLAATKATRTIPIVFTGVADPVSQGIVASLARPGSNVTGISNQYRETSAKTLELLKEIVPSVKYVAILTNPANPSLPLVIQELQAAAKVLQLETSIVQARSPDDFENAFAQAARSRAGGLILLSDSIFNQSLRRLASLAAQHKLPVIGAAPTFPEGGGLMSYGWNRPAHIRRGAELLDKILKGAKPADLPVEQPTKFDLIVNLKTAKALGLTVPSTIMVRADRVIQ